MERREILKWLRKKRKELEWELNMVNQLLQLLETDDESSLDSLPWRRYRSGEGEWVFADEAPEWLMENLRRESPLKIDDHIYSLKKGRGRTFISRKTAT